MNNDASWICPHGTPVGKRCNAAIICDMCNAEEKAMKQAITNQVTPYRNEVVGDMVQENANG